MGVTRFSQLFAPTLKEAPADATAVSHALLVRAGFIRQLGAGLYSHLPLAMRTLGRIEAIVREEMGAIGGQEFRLPALHPAELWRETGRWDEIDDSMFRLTDRRGSEMALGMTHEEVFTDIARRELRSYRDLPQIWFQIQTKFRDEARPKGGLLRVREFAMKDSYSFDGTVEGLDKAFELHRGAYERIFRRCGIEAVGAQAFSGMMGGRESVEFMAATEAGEDTIAHCAACGWAANVEVAASRVAAVVDEPSGLAEPEVFPTPGAVTIEALTKAPYGVAAERQLKTLIYVADGQPVVAVVRGDDELNQAKLQIATGAAQLRQAEVEEIVALMGAHPGSLGAVGFRGATVLVDEAVAGRTNMVTGANRDGFHLRGVDVGRDVLRSAGGAEDNAGRLNNAGGAGAADLRMVKEGEGCVRCGGALRLFTALEVGHIFKLGTRYAEKLGANVLLADGGSVPIVMGSYGIGIGRIMAAAVEQHNDEKGIVWPMAIAPFDAAVLPLTRDEEVLSAADEAVSALEAAGVEVLYDDRDARAGVKLNDAELIGIPIRVAIGKRSLADGRRVEWKRRGEGGDVELVAMDELEARVRRG